MKRFLLLLMSAIFVCIPTLTASAETVTLHEKLALAIQSAKIQDSNGSTVNAQIVLRNEASDAVSVSLTRNGSGISASDVAVMNFDGVNLNVTSADFESFDVFTGLKELKIALPGTFSGEFPPSFNKLSALDVSGSTADFFLTLYNTPKIVSVNASGCSNLKAVSLAFARSQALSTDTAMVNQAGIKIVDKLVVNPLSSLEILDLSDTPRLNRVSYAFPSEISVTQVQNNPLVVSFDSYNHTFGCEAHCVTTTIRQNTIYRAEETSYPEAVGKNPVTTVLGGTGGEICIYTGNDIELAPSLRAVILKNSGVDSANYIRSINISAISPLVSADFSGMTRLSDFTLPYTQQLKFLSLRGDTGISFLDLSNASGFTWPEGFTTLTGLRDFRMKNRKGIDSVDLSSFTQLVSLDFTNSSLSALDLSASKALVSLYVGNNSLYSLDLSSHEMLKNVDVRNNSLVKLDLSQNLGIHVNDNSTENAVVTVSPQTRYMTGKRSASFSFSDIGLTPTEYANVVQDSIKGDGIGITSYDSLSGTVKFPAPPSVITYDYMTGIYYERDTRQFCMNVRLVWDDPYVPEPDSEDVPGTDSGVYSSSGGGCYAVNWGVIALAVMILRRKR